MKISTRFPVAIHTLVILNIKKDTLVTSDQIALSVNTNPVVIRRILAMLKSAGMVDMKRGVGGAYLTRNAEDINLYEVFEVVGSITDGCLFEFHSEPSQECFVGANIQSVVQSTMDNAQKAMVRELEKVTIADITKDLLEKVKITK